MASHSSTLAWKIPWMEEPGGLQSMGSQRVRHDWATSLSLFSFLHWRRKWQPTPLFLPGESQGQGAWWTSVYGVSQSRTRLKRLSSSSSSNVLQVHPCFCKWQGFLLLWLHNIPLDSIINHIIFIHSSVNILGYFHVLATGNNAAMNTGVFSSSR